MKIEEDITTTRLLTAWQTSISNVLVELIPTEGIEWNQKPRIGSCRIRLNLLEEKTLIVNLQYFQDGFFILSDLSLPATEAPSTRDIRTQEHANLMFRHQFSAAPGQDGFSELSDRVRIFIHAIKKVSLLSDLKDKQVSTDLRAIFTHILQHIGRYYAAGQT